jgi:ketosteroid isomerase-like protein
MPREQILSFAHDWADAERRGDVDFLARNLVDDFVGVGPRGFPLTKEQWLARYRSGDLRNESFALQEVAVRDYGEAAVAVGIQDQRTSFQGHDASGRFRATLIVVRQAGRWLIAGWQASGPLPDAPPSRG